MKEVKFSTEEIEIPIPKEMLEEIKKIAEKTRKIRLQK